MSASKTDATQPVLVAPMVGVSPEDESDGGSLEQRKQDVEVEDSRPDEARSEGVQRLSASLPQAQNGGAPAPLRHRRNSSCGSGVNLIPTPMQLRDPMEAPVRKLSVNLIRTYKYINQVYYENKRRRQAEEAALAAASSALSSGPSRNYAAGGTDAAPNTSSSSVPDNEAELNQTKKQSQGNKANVAKSEDDKAIASGANETSGKKRTYNHGYDDEHSDYIIRIGERIQNRYVIKQKIGKGSFGQVVRAFDETRNENVAIKIIKSRRPFFKQAKTEIALLWELNEKDRDDKWFIVRLWDTFVHRHHQCLVFEMLSYNLYDLLRNTAFFGVSLNLIRKFARQILKALYFLAREDTDIIHCDLKPENILLRHPKRSAIKVIDFGSSCKSDQQTYTYIQSRFYRSPEIILGRPYSVAIDMWSLGCILVEMHTGEPLFSGSDEHEQIVRLVAIRGMPPDNIIASSTKGHQFFERKSATEIATEKSDSLYHGSSYRLLPRRRGDPIDEQVRSHRKSLPYILGMGRNNGPAFRRQAEPGHSTEMYELFVDMIDMMLSYDPSNRITPKAALNHPFILSDQDTIVSKTKTDASKDEIMAKSAEKTAMASAKSELNSSAKTRLPHRETGANRKDVRGYPRPGSAPATASSGGISSLRRSSRVAKQQRTKS